MNPYSILYGNFTNCTTKPKKQTSSNTYKKKTTRPPQRTIYPLYRHKKRRYTPLFAVFLVVFGRRLWGKPPSHIRIYPFKFFYLIFPIIADNDSARSVVCLAQLESIISVLAKVYSLLLICFRVFLNLDVPL